MRQQLIFSVCVHSDFLPPNIFETRVHETLFQKMNTISSRCFGARLNVDNTLFTHVSCSEHKMSSCNVHILKSSLLPTLTGTKVLNTITGTSIYNTDCHVI